MIVLNRQLKRWSRKEKVQIKERKIVHRSKKKRLIKETRKLSKDP
jgi:hypothetical protein